MPAPYEGEPIDVWSAGIVFFALLVGSEYSPGLVPPTYKDC